MRLLNDVPALKLAPLVLLLSFTARGQMQNMAVDETGLMRGATKIAVFIKLGTTLPAPYKPDYQRAKDQISKKLEKQKLRLVADPSETDLVLVATEYNAEMGATATASTVGSTTTATSRDLICLCDELKVFKGGRTPAESDNAIWSVSETCGWSWPLNRAMDKFEHARHK